VCVRACVHVSVCVCGSIAKKLRHQPRGYRFDSHFSVVVSLSKRLYLHCSSCINEDLQACSGLKSIGKVNAYCPYFARSMWDLRCPHIHSSHSLMLTLST